MKLNAGCFHVRKYAARNLTSSSEIATMKNVLIKLYSGGGGRRGFCSPNIPTSMEVPSSSSKIAGIADKIPQITSVTRRPAGSFSYESIR